MGHKKELYLDKDGVFVEQNDSYLSLPDATVDSDHESQADFFVEALKMKLKLKKFKARIAELKSIALDDDPTYKDLEEKQKGVKEALASCWEKVTKKILSKHEWFSPGNREKIFTDHNGSITVKDKIDWRISHMSNFMSWIDSHGPEVTAPIEIVLKKVSNSVVLEAMKFGKYDIPGVQLVNTCEVKTRLSNKKDN